MSFFRDSYSSWHQRASGWHGMGPTVSALCASGLAWRAAAPGKTLPCPLRKKDGKRLRHRTATPVVQSLKGVPPGSVKHRVVTSKSPPCAWLPLANGRGWAGKPLRGKKGTIASL